MRNLCIQAENKRRAPLNDGEQVQHMCVNSAEHRVYVATSDLRVICLDPDGKVSWDAPLTSAGAANPPPSITSFSHVMELEALCVALSSGELQLLHLTSMELEDVGSVQGGALALEWSPDGETCAVLTGAGNLLLMNREWELLEEVPLPLNSSELSTAGDVASIAWRGDAKVFATSVLDGDKRLLQVWEREGCRLESTAEELPGASSVMSWQPNGRHLYVAAAGSAAGVHRVVMFERNGLQHGGFDATGPGPVAGLSWSSDSELLAVVRAPEGIQVDATPSGADAHWTVQVWHRNCWHWYLKYEQRFTNSGGHLSTMWDDTSTSLLHLVTASGYYTSLQFRWTISSTPKGTIAVVDGWELMLTPLRRKLVPPPSCAVRGLLPGAIAHLALHSGEAREVAAALMADGRLGVLRSPCGDKWEKAKQVPNPHPVSKTNPGKSAEIHIAADTVPLPAHIFSSQTVKGLAWLSEDTLMLLACCDPTPDNPSTGGDVLVEVVLDMDRLEVVGTSELACDQSFTHMLSRPGGGLLLQASAGEIYTFFSGCKLMCVPKAGHFPTCCSHVFPAPSVDHADTHAPLVGLTASGNLYWGPTSLADGCTSVAIRSAGPGGPALLYTTRNQQLHVRLFSELVKGPGAKSSEAQPTAGKTIFRSQLQQRSAFSAAMRPAGADEGRQAIQQRLVEQGATIVVAPAHSVRVVLLMPRGNLEGIAPRGLLLVALAEALKERRYSDAWKAATTHRVDLNLLVDYMWPAFVLHAHEVVAAVQDPADLCDLLHALNSKSVLEPGGIYCPLPGPEALRGPEAPAEALEGGKVTAVCRAVRRAVEAVDPQRYLMVRVTSFARSHPPELPRALQCVAEAKEAALAQGNTDDSLAESALRHLLLSVDVDTLQRAALGMYDLALAYMVAVQGGKDPGEQLLQLQEFEQEENLHLRRYKIDLHLKQYSEAIKHLMEAGPQAHVHSALALAKKHGLMKELLALCPRGSAAYMLVLEAWAEQLQAADKLEDAALALLAAGKVDKAIWAYRSAGQWKMALALAGQQGYSPQQLQNLAQEVVEQLHAWGDHMGMAAVLEQYIGDVDNAVSALTTAREWREAVRVSHRHGRVDLVETVVAPSAAEAADLTLKEAAENVERIGKYLQRLQDVQRKRVAMQDALQDDEDRPDMDDDLHTEGASTVAGLSMYTDATHTQASTASSTRTPSTVGGRKPLRHQRKNKKGRVRPGTAQEEAQLAAHIRELGPSDSLLSHVGQLTELLVLLGHQDDAATLQNNVGAWLSTHQAAVQQLDNTPVASDAPGSSAGTSKAPAPANAPKDKTVKSQTQWKWEILRPM